MRNLQSSLSRLSFKIMFFLVFFVGIANAQEAPDRVVNRVLQEVLSASRKDPSSIKQLVNQVFDRYFDVERMTRLVMGRAWRQATLEQQKNLTLEFRTLLIRTYSAAFSAYGEVEAKVRPLTILPTDDDVVIRTEVKTSTSNRAFFVDYAIYKTPSGWKAYDIVVQGLSLIKNNRDIFADQINRSGIDGLIATLREKNAG